MAKETEDLELDPETARSGTMAPVLDPEKGFYVVADEEGDVIGSLMVTFEWSNWRDGWVWWITSVYVVPEKRGESVFRRLYEFVRGEAHGRGGVCGIRLYVAKANSSAQEVYRRIGMEEADYTVFEEMF